MKKKILLMLVLLGIMIYIPNVIAAESVDIKGCESIISGVKIDVKIANLVHTVILVIQVAVPVVLIIFGMLDLFKSVMAQKDDEIKKGQQIFIKRIVAAVLVFFVIAVVKLVISLVANKSEGIISCANCFLNGADENTGKCNDDDGNSVEPEENDAGNGDKQNATASSNSKN